MTVFVGMIQLTETCGPIHRDISIATALRFASDRDSFSFEAGEDIALVVPIVDVGGYISELGLPLLRLER